MSYLQDTSHNDVKSSESILAATLKTLGWASIGTGALVAIHHQYRKRHHTQAQLQDYVHGAKATLKRIHRANSLAASSAQQAWLAAWQLSADDCDQHHSCNNNSVINNSVIQEEDQNITKNLLKDVQQKSWLATDTQTTQLSSKTAQDRSVNNADPVVWVSGVAELSKGEFAVVGIANNASKDNNSYHA